MKTYGRLRSWDTIWVENNTPLPPTCTHLQNDHKAVSSKYEKKSSIWAANDVCLEEASVQFSRSVMSDSLQPHELHHARPPCPSATPGVHLNSCPSSRWCHRAISSSVVPFSSFPQSLPASDYFPMCQLLASGGQSIGVSGSKFCTQCASTFGKFSPGFRTGKYQFW